VNYVILTPSYKESRKSDKKKLVFSYLLWFLGFFVSNVLWGLWIIFAFLLKEKDQAIVLGKRESWEEVKEEHVRWAKKSALAFVVLLPCFFALSAISFKALIWIPYSWFFYRCFVGFVCLLFDKKPFKFFDFFGKKKTTKRFNDDLIVFKNVHFLR